MTKLMKASIVTLALSSITVFAGSGHSHDEDSHKGHDHAQTDNPHKGHSHDAIYDKVKPGMSKEGIEKAAKAEVQSLVAKKKIPKSWKSMPISKIGKTHYGDTDDWVVGFDNMQIKNKERQTLYIFVSVGGKIRGANYTGN
jgi:hypothetical protein